MGITPNTRIGGQDDFESKIVKVMSGLGNILGLLIFAFTVLLIAVDVVLNPIFLFSQAKNSGIDIGTPFGPGALAWWTVIVITICTTGLQYALLQPGKKTWGIGHIVGLIIMAMDTVMDGGGFLAWKEGGGSLLNLSGDSSHLQWGMFPVHGAAFGEWFAYGAVCVICAFHETFLSKVLGLLTFDFDPVKTDIMSVNIGRWVNRAGILLSRIKLIVLSLTPYIMLGLDVMLFPQSVRGQDGTTQFIWIILTFFVTTGTLALWRYYDHLRTAGGHKIKDLDRPHQLMFAGAIVASAVDSYFDLRGFNEAVYHQAASIPQNLPPGGFQQWLLTAGIVMLICTAFAPMYSHLFGPIARVAAAIPGYNSMPDIGSGEPDFGGGDPFDNFDM